jgi:uncharacterized cupin superfamily protein
MSTDSPCLIRSDNEDRAPAMAVRHPLNPSSELAVRALGRAAGLIRTSVSLAVLAPGRESFIYHSHHVQEEWLYIIEGYGTAIIDGEDYFVEAGDFMGFPTPSVAHTLINTSDEDLVYLMGGETGAVEIGEFPELGKMAIRDGKGAYLLDVNDLKPIARPSED